MDLQTLRELPIDFTEKGFAFLGGPEATAARIAAARPPLHAVGFSYPLLTLHERALHHNATAMAEYCAAHGVDLAPHGKTAMSPELAARQLSSGAWAITVATIGQLRTYRAFGFNRLLLANELVDEASIAWLRRELAIDPLFEVYSYVDNIANIETHMRVAGPGKPLPVLVEIGHPHGRTGCRTDTEALAVAEAARASGVLRVAGVAGYEGTIKGEDAPEQIAGFCRRLRRLADLVRREGDRDNDEGFIVSAGGSSYFDVVTRELTAGDTSGLRVVLRSGAYLFFDHGLYATMSPQGRGVADAPVFRPAIELWAQVLSRPEPGLALLGFGRRDVGSDSTLPVPLRTVPPQTVPPQTVPLRTASQQPADQQPAGQQNTVTTGWRITQLSDQHAFLELPAEAELQPGDLVGLGISHPCTTLDRWRLIPTVDANGRVTDVVHTFF